MDQKVGIRQKPSGNIAISVANELKYDQVATQRRSRIIRPVPAEIGTNRLDSGPLAPENLVV